MKNNIRTHILGSNWIYLKVYAHQEIVDKVILNDLVDIYNKKLKNIAINFHFVRYFDPEFHLRIRIEIHNLEDILNVITVFHKYLTKLIYKQLISRVEYSTYEREIERYGLDTISNIERLFTIDSIRILNVLRDLKGLDNDERYRSLLGLIVIDNTMNSFKISIERRITILKSLANSYFEEMQITHDGYLNILNNRYRDERLFYMEIYNNTIVDQLTLTAKKSLDIFNTEYNVIVSEIRNKIQQVDCTEILITDLIHMSMNRLFTSDNNLIEAILYYYASKNYSTIHNLSLTRIN